MKNLLIRLMFNGLGRAKIRPAACVGRGRCASAGMWAGPVGEILARFAGRLPEAEMAVLAVAWLKDQLPEALRRHVAILPVAEGLNSEPQAEDDVLEEFSGEFHQFSADLRERLEFFGLLSIHNPSIRKILDVCYEAAAGRGER